MTEPVKNKAINPTRPQVISYQQRVDLVVELRQRGLSYRKIANGVIGRFGVENLPKGYDERYAYADIRNQLEKWRATAQEGIEEIIEQEVMRLDRLHEAHWDKALAGNVRSTEMCLRIQERRAKLFGYDQPVKVQMDFRATLVSEIRLGKIDINQLKQEMGEDYVNDLMRGVDTTLFERPKNEDDIVDAEFSEIPTEQPPADQNEGNPPANTNIEPITE